MARARPFVRRVLLIGAGGAGKSALARRLGAAASAGKRVVVLRSPRAVDAFARSAAGTA